MNDINMQYLTVPSAAMLPEAVGGVLRVPERMIGQPPLCRGHMRHMHAARPKLHVHDRGWPATWCRNYDRPLHRTRECWLKPAPMA